MVDDPDREVVLVSGLGGLKPGKISTSTSYLNMGLSTRATETYTLTLNPNSKLDPGDCGSWVVDIKTCEVYGHIVALDALGEACIVPFNAALRDIQGRLSARSVSLPTETESPQPLGSFTEGVSNRQYDQKKGKQPASPTPNPFEEPAAMQRLMADVDRLQLDQGHSPAGSVGGRRALLGPPPCNSELFSTSEQQRGDGNTSRSSGRRHSTTRRQAQGVGEWLEGYKFIIEPTITIRQNDPWARTRRTTMIASQATLLQQLDKQQARGRLASQQYDALGMEGSRRRQIDRLLDERDYRDPRHEYQLASVKLNQRPIASDIMDIQSMRVILIQRPRQGVPADTLVNYPSLLTSEIVDLAYYDTTQRHRHVSTVGVSGYTSNAT